MFSCKGEVKSREQLQDTGPFLKAFRFGGSFGSAVVKEREMNYLSVKCWVYECGGSFGSFGSTVDKKKKRNELFER